MTPNRLLETIRHRHLANPQLRCYAEGDEVHPSLFLSTNVNRCRQAVSQVDWRGDAGGFGRPGHTGRLERDGETAAIGFGARTGLGSVDHDSP